MAEGFGPRFKRLREKVDAWGKEYDEHRAADRAFLERDRARSEKARKEWAEHQARLKQRSQQRVKVYGRAGAKAEGKPINPNQEQRVTKVPSEVSQVSPKTSENSWKPYPKREGPEVSPPTSHSILESGLNGAGLSLTNEAIKGTLRGLAKRGATSSVGSTALSTSVRAPLSTETGRGAVSNIVRRTYPKAGKALRFLGAKATTPLFVGADILLNPDKVADSTPEGWRRSEHERIAREGRKRRAIRRLSEMVKKNKYNPGPNT